MRRLGLAFVDTDPNRQRLHRDLIGAVNELAGSVVETATPPTADTEFAVAHDLGRVPVEFSVLLRDAPGIAYRSSPEKWTERIAYLKFSATGGPSVRLRLRFR